MRFIPLKNRLGKIVNHAIIDDEDFKEVSNFFWCLQQKENGYVVSVMGSKKNKKVFLHRFILNAKKGQIIDHINRNRLDCRKQNLRFVNTSKNVINSPKRITNTSGFKGVSWSKSNKGWIAQIKKNYCYYYLGTFKNKLDAAKRYNESAKKLFGVYAWLNRI